MAKQPKEPKPKKLSYERIDPHDDPDGIYPLLRELVANERSDLVEAEIALAWRVGWKADKDGLMPLGKCKKAADLEKEFHTYDFVIILNAEAWKKLSAVQRRALVHHELMHAAVSEDKESGEVKRDAKGRPVFRIRKHDLEEFRDIVTKYGCYKADIEAFVNAAMSGPKAPTLFDPADEGEDGDDSEGGESRESA